MLRLVCLSASIIIAVISRQCGPNILRVTDAVENIPMMSKNTFSDELRFQVTQILFMLADTSGVCRKNSSRCHGHYKRCQVCNRECSGNHASCGVCCSTTGGNEILSSTHQLVVDDWLAVACARSNIGCSFSGKDPLQDIPEKLIYTLSNCGRLYMKLKIIYFLLVYGCKWIAYYCVCVLVLMFFLVWLWSRRSDSELCFQFRVSRICLSFLKSKLSNVLKKKSHLQLFIYLILNGYNRTKKSYHSAIGLWYYIERKKLEFPKRTFKLVPFVWNGTLQWLLPIVLIFSMLIVTVNYMNHGMFKAVFRRELGEGTGTALFLDIVYWILSHGLLLLIFGNILLRQPFAVEKLHKSLIQVGGYIKELCTRVKLLIDCIKTSKTVLAGRQWLSANWFTTIEICVDFDFSFVCGIQADADCIDESKFACSERIPARGKSGGPLIDLAETTAEPKKTYTTTPHAASNSLCHASTTPAGSQCKGQLVSTQNSKCDHGASTQVLVPTPIEEQTHAAPRCELHLPSLLHAVASHGTIPITNGCDLHTGGATSLPKVDNHEHQPNILGEELVKLSEESTDSHLKLSELVIGISLCQGIPYYKPDVVKDLEFASSFFDTHNSREGIRLLTDCEPCSEINHPADVEGENRSDLFIFCSKEDQPATDDPNSCRIHTEANYLKNHEKMAFSKTRLVYTHQPLEANDRADKLSSRGQTAFSGYKNKQISTDVNEICQPKSSIQDFSSCERESSSLLSVDTDLVTDCEKAPQVSPYPKLPTQQSEDPGAKLGSTYRPPPVGEENPIQGTGQFAPQSILSKAGGTQSGSKPIAAAAKSTKNIALFVKHPQSGGQSLDPSHSATPTNPTSPHHTDQFQAEVSDYHQLPTDATTDDIGESVLVTAGADCSRDFHSHDHCLVHTSTTPTPAYTNQTALVRGIDSAPFSFKMIETAVEECTELSLKPDVFLSALNLHRILTKNVTTTDFPNYLFKCSKLEFLYKEIENTPFDVATTNNSSKCKVLLFDRKTVDRILSCFKWLDDEDKKRLKKELLKTKRDGWNAIKNSIEAVDMVHIPNLASKLGLQFPLPNSRKPAIDEFLQVLTELDVAYKKWGACRVSKSQIILALQSSSASLQLLDAVLSQGLVWTCQFVQSSDAVKYASLLCDTKERFSGFLDVILDDVTAKLKDELSQSLRRLPPLHGSVQQCLVAWLAVRTEVPEGPVTWDNFVEMVKSLGQDATTIVSDQRDFLSSIRKPAHLQLGHGVSEQPQLYQSKQEQEPHPVAVGESKNGSGRAKSSSSSHTQSSGYESLVESLQNSNWETNEEKLLTDCLNLGNPFSIIAHAKEYYLTGDFSLATTVLGHLDHHLSVDGRVVRAKYFGIGVCHYRQRQYSKALENFNRLKDASIKTASADIHSRGDLTSAYVYLGETYFAQNQLERAYTMYMEAKKIYSGSDNTVAHLLGAFMQSKSAILTKAGTCLRLLHRHTQAESILDDAVSLASEARNKLDGDHLTLEASKKLREVYRDEVSARTSLGNLHQILGKYSQASSNYRITLDLQSKLDSDCLHYSWAQGNLGNSLINERKVSEAIPHLKSAYALARKFERHGSDIARTANNLGNAYQISKEFDQAEEYYQISLGHSVFCRDTAGHARSLGNLGNVRILQGKHKEAIRIFTEAIDLDYERDINITAYQNRAGAYIQLAKEVSGGSEWEPVSQHVQSLEPSGMQSFGMPVQECTQSHHLENKRLALVAPTGSYTQLPLDDSADILTKQQPLPAVPPTTSAAPSRDREDVRKGPGLSLMPPLEDLNPSYRKYYLEQARDDLSTSLSLIESQFKEMQQDISSLRALSPFDAHSNGFYTLQKVLVLLGDHQGSLRVAEQNRARNIGVALSSKRQPALPRVVQNNPGGPSPTNPSPFGLDELWEAVSREKVPVIMLSYIQDDATIFAHLVVPYDSQKLEEDSGRLTGALSYRSDDSGIAKSFSSNIDSSVSSRFSLESTSSRSTTSISTASSDDLLIPPPYYHFMQISVEKESFVNKQYNSLAYTNTDGPIPFHEYIIKTLINYMNQKELDLFHPIDFQDNDSPLTIIFEKLAHVFVEEIEKRCPDVREFVVIADKASHFIPWPLLQSERGKVFLGDKYRVRTYPSLHSMGIMNSQPTKEIALPSQERFLVIGNPSIPSFKLAGQEHTLGRLQHAESEAFSVSHFLETSPLVKEMATKPTVLFRLERSQIVHIATHASAVGGYLAFACSVPVVGTNNPVEAKETLMFINEIQSLNISASLVVLSACDSARGELVNDGVNSLANAFLTAGAESVLVSLVRVPDKSASIFMSSFYRFLTHHGVTTSEAIQKSSMIIRCIRSLSQHVHWGGYRLLGRDIRMRYDPTCPAARVAGLLGETSAFPRLKLLKELEKAIFRQDRSPPRDVVIVKGMAAYEPAEVVRDFVAKRFSHFPGGILWYNCASPQLLEASIQSAKEALSKLKNLPTVPPSDSQYSGTHSKLDSSPHFTDHFKLVILDSPYNFQDCVRKITSSQDITQHDVDIIVIGSLETDTDKSLSLFADSELIRGCTHVEVGDLDRYASIQRMAYNLLSKQHFCPYEDDYFAFETLTKFCRGSATVVKVFEGLLATSESDSDTNIVRSLAQDIDRTKDLVCIYGDEEVTAATQPATATSSWTALSVASAILQTGKKLVRLGRETKKAEHHVRNGLITDATARRLSNEDCVMLSDGLEKLSRLMDSMSNFLTLEVSPDAHFILQCLSYLSIPDAHDVHSESTFTFPECFLTQIAICVAHTNKSLSAHKLLSELKGMNLLRRYPQPLLAPPEQTDSECLFYVPDLIVRCVTYDMDDADRAFGLTVMSQAFDYIPTPSPLDYSVTAVDDRLKQLFRNEGLYRQTSKFPWPSSETFRLTFTEPQISHLPKVGEKSMVRSSDSPNYPPL